MGAAVYVCGACIMAVLCSLALPSVCIPNFVIIQVHGAAGFHALLVCYACVYVCQGFACGPCSLNQCTAAGRPWLILFSNSYNAQRWSPSLSRYTSEDIPSAVCERPGGRIDALHAVAGPCAARCHWHCAAAAAAAPRYFSSRSHCCIAIGLAEIAIMPAAELLCMVSGPL